MIDRDRSAGGPGEFLGGHPPFDAPDADTLRRAGRGGACRRVRAGRAGPRRVRRPSVEVFVVVSGGWTSGTTRHGSATPPDEALGPGGLFGFSAMLTERSVGPRAVAAGRVAVVARIPASAVEPAFTSRQGARFLAEQLAAVARQPSRRPTYSIVDELIRSPPLVVRPDRHGRRRGPVDDRATAAPAPRSGSATGIYGLVTDALLRQRILVDGLPASARSARCWPPPPRRHGRRLGRGGADPPARRRTREFLLVTRRGRAGSAASSRRGTSPSRRRPPGVSLHEQLRRAATVDELADRRAAYPPCSTTCSPAAWPRAGSSRSTRRSSTPWSAARSGWSSQQHPELVVDAFTWLSLGSNGRREAVPSSDVDSRGRLRRRVAAGEIARLPRRLRRGPRRARAGPG